MTQGHLIIQHRGQVLRAVPLTAAVLTIGRVPDNDLVLDDPLVSKRHAEIKLEAWAPFLTDVGSKHGTFLRGRRLPAHQPTRLQDSEHLQIGPFVLTYLSRAPVRMRGRGKELTSGILDRIEQLTPAQLPGTHLMPHLPALFQGADFLSRYLLIFETLWEPHEWRQDHLPLYFDPRTAPASFLPFLARWFGAELSAGLSEGRARAYLSEYVELQRWRGTSYALARLIFLCTGVEVDVTEEPSVPFVFRVTAHLPHAQDLQGESREQLVHDIERLIQQHKPAHCGYILDAV